MSFNDPTSDRQDECLALETGQPKQDCHICGLPEAPAEHLCCEDVSGPVQGSQDPYVGKIVGGHYEVLARIGQGGMSVVYKARHDLLKTVVALKILKPTLAMDSTKLLQFQQEAESVSKLDHPNIMRIWHFDIPEGAEPYLVMDYVRGEPLSSVLEKQGPLPVQRAVKIFSKVCSALAHAHEVGIVHRDIKPSNIILNHEGGAEEIVKIVDFGIAKLLDADEGSESLPQAGEVFGSPLYMSPEQCAGKAVDERSDVYSTACVIFEALVGEPPFMGETPLDIMHMHVFNAPRTIAQARPDLAQAAQLDRILAKALAKHPASRHQNMIELQEDLETVIRRDSPAKSLA